MAIKFLKGIISLCKDCKCSLKKRYSTESMIFLYSTLSIAKVSMLLKQHYFL